MVPKVAVASDWVGYITKLCQPPLPQYNQEFVAQNCTNRIHNLSLQKEGKRDFGQMWLDIHTAQQVHRLLVDLLKSRVFKNSLNHCCAYNSNHEFLTLET